MEFGGLVENEFCPEDKLITINNRTNLRSQLHILLHEASHAILCCNKSAYKARFPKGHNDRAHGINYKVDIIREEVICWEKGLEIAKNLDIKIDLKWYNKHRTEALWSYISNIPWSGKKGW